MFICLGDSNPFDDSYLEGYLKDAIKKNWDIKDEQIKVTIENEAMPNADKEGWFEFNNGKFVPYFTGKMY